MLAPKSGRFRVVSEVCAILRMASRQRTRAHSQCNVIEITMCVICSFVEIVIDIRYTNILPKPLLFTGLSIMIFLNNQHNAYIN